MAALMAQRMVVMLAAQRVVLTVESTVESTVVPMVG